MLILGGRSPAQTHELERVQLDGEKCLTCPKSIDGEGVQLMHRGRRVYLHDGPCADAWFANPAEFFRQLQPAGALFDEGPEATRVMRSGWLIFGVYVVIGLVFAAASGYLAIQRGHAAVSWFFYGLVFNVFAFGALALKPAVPAVAAPAGVPPGMRKVPATHAPAICPECGAENHPSAANCSVCGAVQTPTANSEVEKV